jgi:hypothetical protein
MGKVLVLYDCVGLMLNRPAAALVVVPLTARWAWDRPGTSECEPC